MKPCDCDFPRPDRRTARTRRQLSGALIDLLQEQSWEQIGIAELCARADVARSTFYLHYANKEEVMESGFSALRDTIRAEAPVSALKDSGGFGFIAGVAAHIFGNRIAFLAIAGANGSGIVRERFRRLLSGLISEELAAAGRADPALAQFLAGGFEALAIHAMNAKRQNQHEFAARFGMLAKAALAA